MSYQPPPNGQPTGDPRQRLAEEQNAQVEQLLGGELIGEGYLFADDPEERAKQLIETNAEFVRQNLLRAIEVMTFDLQLPYSQDKKADVGKAVLECAQAYLLLDPTVDETGVPVEGEGSKAQAAAKAVHQFPPHVQPNAGEQKVAGKNEGKSVALKNTRPQQPRPKPRA